MANVKSTIMQDTGKYRTNIKDQFYTNIDVAKYCIGIILSLLPAAKQYLWVEPSAGNGVFLHNLPNHIKKIGLDIDPKAKDIQQQDYLEWQPPTGRPIIVFGNPPFGRQSSLAKAFISKSCTFADVIAFILPKSFIKPSMNNAFDRKFHLLQSIELNKNSFVINDEPYDVPCVFQIWQKKDVDREIEQKVSPEGFQYVKPSEEYDMVFRRVGGLAGKCYKQDEGMFSPQSHYFIHLNDDIVPFVDTIIEHVNAHIFPSNTLGPRSLSKSEANIVLNRIIEDVSS